MDLCDPTPGSASAKRRGGRARLLSFARPLLDTRSRRRSFGRTPNATRERKRPRRETFPHVEHVPLFGTTLLLGVMVVRELHVRRLARRRARTGAPRTLQAARFGAYGTVALIARRGPLPRLRLRHPRLPHPLRRPLLRPRRCRCTYLLTALWGGQDGSLLWWLFLLSVYIGACVKWLGKKYLELQPYVIATLMAVVLFFCVLMAFAANPFSTSVAGRARRRRGAEPAPPELLDGHPPAVASTRASSGARSRSRSRSPRSSPGGSTTSGSSRAASGRSSRGCSSASATRSGCSGRTRSSAGAATGAWDPVENAAFMPFLTASAFVHSVMIQERRGLLKVWNVFLVWLTFFLTIFGTFLTRSGDDRERPLVRAVVDRHLLRRGSSPSRRPSRRRSSSVAGPSCAICRRRRGCAGRRSSRAGSCIARVRARALRSSGSLPLPVPVRVALIALVAGAAVFVALELVFRRMTRGLDARSASARRSSRSSRASSRSS